jgi:hypothetical protein
MSMLLYLVMAFWAAMGWCLQHAHGFDAGPRHGAHRRHDDLRGAVDGALWGKPTWGTWWVWDARLTSELLLLFLYLGYMALVAAIDDPRRADRPAPSLALVGAVNVPIIYFSVKWWNTLHQGATISMTARPDGQHMLTGMLLMVFACWAYAFAVALHARARHHPRTRARHRLGGAPSCSGSRRMHWNSLGSFLAMGGYGLYVWGSFGVTAALLVLEPMVPGAPSTRRALPAATVCPSLEGSCR